MARRKQPHTREEILAEQEHAQQKIRQYQNQETMLRNAYSQEERKLRTRRLCTEAGILERFVPELKEMSPELSSEFIITITTGQEAEEILLFTECQQHDNSLQIGPVRLKTKRTIRFILSTRGAPSDDITG